MAESVLMLHKGAKEVSFESLKDYQPPAPSGRWYPLAHARVVEVVKSTLQDAGYLIKKERYGLTGDGHRFFGTLDLGTPIAEGVALAVGVRNSTDQSFPLGFCAGTRVFCCDNLAFRSELLVRKKHTLNGERNFIRSISGAVTTLESFKEAEAERIKRFLTTELSVEQADSLILRAFERGMIGHRDLPKVLHEWRNPAFPEFQPRTIFSLLNAFTSGLKDRAIKQPAEYARQTMSLHGLLDNREERVVVAPMLTA